MQGIAPRIIPPYPDEYLLIAKRKVPEKYKRLRDYKSIMDSYRPEILVDYDKAMRWYLMKYVLNDPSEWKRLKIQTFPAEYPVMMIRAPVPWHTGYVLAEQSMERRYFKGHIVVIKIRDLWTDRFDCCFFFKFFPMVVVDRFKHMLILPTELLELEQKFPHDPLYFEERAIGICNKSRQVLLKEWLPMCADILLKYKETWRKFIPKKQGETLANMERFFGTINALLSKQLRLLVVRSLQHFLGFMEKFKVPKKKY